MIGKILNPFKKYAKAIQIAVLLLLLSGVGVFYWLYTSTAEELAHEQARNAELTQRIENINNTIEEDQRNIAVLRGEKQSIQGEFLRVVRELNAMKDRRETVRQKPGLVERQIESSFNNYMKEMSCYTGEVDQCEKQQ